jgi:hypothetical protein
MIDPSIPLQVKPPAMPNPMEYAGNMISLKNMMGQQQIQQNQIQQGDIQLQQMKQNMQDEQTARDILANDPNINSALPKLYKALGPKAATIAKSLIEHDQALATLNKTQSETTRDNLKTFSDAIDEIASLPAEYRDAAYKTKIGNLIQGKLMSPEMVQSLPQQWDDELMMGYGNHLKQTQTALDLKVKTLQEQEAANKASIAAQQAANMKGGVSAEARFQAENRAKSFEEMTYEDWVKDPENRGKNRAQFKEWESAHASTYMGSGDDPKAIAQAIQRGEQPPTMTGLYRMAGPVRAELARNGYDMVKGQNEWNGVQKWISSANSTQQLRLRQAVEKIPPHVEMIEGMYSKLEKIGLPTGFKFWNKAALAAARNLPGETGALATNLEGQINDLSAELGNVYMGGNTPTDEALKLAKSNLSSDWNPQTFHKAIDLIKQNVIMRRNAIRFTGPGGVPTDSPYMPDALSTGAANKDPLGIRK